MKTLALCLPEKILWSTINRFKGKDLEYLGKLILTFSMMIEQMDMMKENKSSAEDGIPTERLRQRNILIFTNVNV